ncbi:MAG: RHS repeat-associated core domain-containing protein, partial [Cyclobacteriaceae bacterium]
NLEALESYRNLQSSPVTVDLTPKNTLADQGSSISHKILNVSPNTNYTFRYDLGVLGSEVADFGCQTCSYSLEISISDIDGKLIDLSGAAGNEATEGEKYIINDINSLSCTDTTELNTVEFTVLLNEIGDYTVTKSLKTIELDFQELVNRVVVSESVNVEILDIINSYTVDSAACEICTSCPEAEAAIDEAIQEVTRQDCENIYQQITQHYQDLYGSTTDGVYEVPEDSIAAHPLYCKYELCIKDQESGVFEKQVARIADWDNAVAASYTDLVSLDPFFNNSSLSGDGYKSSMQSKLNDLLVGTIQYDNNGDGVADGSNTFRGTLAAITDPANTSYYIDANGNPDPANGYHILYYDLMERGSNSLDQETYEEELSKNRWSLYKSFYFESKRKTKLEIPGYANCPAAKEELEQVDNIPQTPQGLEVWGENNNATGPVSNEELEMTLGSIAFNCGTDISAADSTTIAGHLQTYFNDDPGNFFRFIIRPDLQSNPQLLAIQSILAGYNCSLDSIAQDDPLTCVEVPENLVVNDQLDQSGSGCHASDITEDCYNGWAPATGTPNTDIGGGDGRVFLWSHPGDEDSEAILGTFKQPLKAGVKYELCLKYNVFQDGTYNSGRVDNVYMQLSGSRDFLDAQGILNIAGSSSSSSMMASSAFGPDSLSRKQNPRNRNMAASTLSGCTLPMARYPDSVILEGQTAASQYLWFASNSTNVNVYKDTCIVFTPTEESTFFYLATMSCTANTYQAVNIKDLQVREIQPRPNGVWFEGEYVCLNYDTTNTALANFSYTVDWEREVERCQELASQEKELLTNYALQKYLNEAVSGFYNEYSTACMEGVSEQLTCSYDQKEYHYTLYYYDQSGQLVQTVPPAGVRPLSDTQVQGFLAGNVTDPAHIMASTYQYTSLDQLMAQQTPDGGETKMWYNDQGQLRLAQDAQQAADDQYAYTKYDEQGRVVEVGEMTTAIAVADLIQEMDTLQAFPQAASYTLEDITYSYYDSPNPGIQNEFAQQQTRNRVSWMEAVDAPGADTVATYYSYDIHGNVKALLQKLPGIGQKRTDYVYDLISGNVNYVMYQFGEDDQFIHRYIYDSDNRISEVYTSTDGFLWDRDAYYFYYLHGPLARAGLGHHNVQGLDYYYTLQGWLKGVNIPSEADLAFDGMNGSRVGRDAMAFHLGYYDGDYTPVGAQAVNAGQRDALWAHFQSNVGNDGLYNGNIAWMETDLPGVGVQNGNRDEGLQAMLYTYDQLNRINRSMSLSAYTAGSGFQSRTPAAGSPYDTDYSYDANGNLLTLDRRSETGSLADDLDYVYYDETNKLQNVDGSTGQNYSYDLTGNLLSDLDEGLGIEWNLMGKVSKVTKDDGTVISFRYDANGNRILKKVTDGSDTEQTIYVRDAGGNVMAVYKDAVLTEQPIYGSQRLGMYRGGRASGSRQLGAKQYELSNHLGNVLAVVTDNIHMTIDSTWASVVSSTDYHPFGLQMAGRSYENGLGYRYGFQGQEKDDETGVVNYKFRMHNPRIGRFFSIDPLAPKYPHNSPYAFSENRVIDGVELEGLEWQPVNEDGENVAVDSDDIDDYIWVGFDEDGMVLAGTVPEAGVFTGENTMRFFSTDCEELCGDITDVTLDDQHTVNRIDELHPNVRNTFREFVIRSEYEESITLRLGNPVLRTFDTQNNLYAQSRTQEQLNRVGLNNIQARPDLPWATNARGGYSYHNYGLAGDFYRLMDDGSIDWNYDRTPLLRIANSLDLEWLGPTFDPPHYQYTTGRSERELLDLYNDGEVDDDGYLIFPDN